MYFLVYRHRTYSVRPINLLHLHVDLSVPEDSQHKLVEMVETDPYTHKRLPIAPTVFPGKVHLKTHLHRGGPDGDHVLFPFASKRFDIAGPKKDKDGKLILDTGIIQYTKIPDAAKERFSAVFTPDTSLWSHYYIVISGTTDSIMLANPTVRSVGTPLFFEFISSRSGQAVTLTFGSEYVAGAGIELSPSEIVSGIMLFDERLQWTMHTPWTCQGVPLPLKDIVKTPKSKIL